MIQEQKTVTVSIKKILKWLSVIIIVLLISRFGYLLSRNNSSSLRSYSNEIPMITFTDSGSSSSISDTREFMKTSYSGNIKTRDVKNISRDIRGIIRDMDGRIDNEDISEKYGRIDFVIPKSNLDDFRDEIESLVHAKLYTETTSSQNLLNEKKSIDALHVGPNYFFHINNRLEKCGLSRIYQVLSGTSSVIAEIVFLLAQR